MVNRSNLRLRERGLLLTEMMVAMGIVIVAVLPLAFSIAKEERLLRASYHRAVALEIVDGEMEVLLAGEWRSFRPGAQAYVPRAQAATGLPPGQFQLTVTGQGLRLEWLPRKRDSGGKVVREATAR